MVTQTHARFWGQRQYSLRRFKPQRMRKNNKSARWHSKNLVGWMLVSLLIIYLVKYWLKSADTETFFSGVAEDIHLNQLNHAFNSSIPIDHDSVSDSDDDDMDYEADMNPSALPPRCDCLGNEYARVVHTNGIHYIPMISCSACGLNDPSKDFLSLRLIPTTFGKPTTFFTTMVLDDYRLSNLEMKVSAYQYTQKLWRVTAPVVPKASRGSIYEDLRRLSRCWRWLKKLKWAGFGQTNQDPLEAKPAQLTIFCPACPQPGINLPPEWEHNKDKWVAYRDFHTLGQKLTTNNSYIYRRAFIADGNFKADHVRLSRVTNDIWLLDGAGMMPNRSEYSSFLENAQDYPTVRAAIDINACGNWHKPSGPLVKTNSRLLNRRHSTQKLAMWLES